MGPITLFKCLVDKTRLQTVLLIQSGGEFCVCELTAAPAALIGIGNTVIPA